MSSAQSIILQRVLVRYKQRLQDMEYEYGLGHIHAMPIRRCIKTVSKKLYNTRVDHADLGTRYTRAKPPQKHSTETSPKFGINEETNS